MSGSCYRTLDQIPCRAPCNRYSSDEDPFQEYDPNFIYEGFGDDDDGSDANGASTYFGSCDFSKLSVPRCLNTDSTMNIRFPIKENFTFGGLLPGMQRSLSTPEKLEKYSDAMNTMYANNNTTCESCNSDLNNGNYTVPHCQKYNSSPTYQSQVKENYEKGMDAMECESCNSHLNNGNYTVPHCQKYNSSPTYVEQIKRGWSS